MPDKEAAKGEIQDFRKGVVIFSLLLAFIVAVGIYLFVAANDLNSQYTTVEETFVQN